jgi:hypothetical protein
MNGSLVVRETSAEAIGEMAIMADVNVLKPLLIKTTGDDDDNDHDISYYINHFVGRDDVTLILITITIMMIIIKMMTSIYIHCNNLSTS